MPFDAANVHVCLYLEYLLEALSTDLRVLSGMLLLSHDTQLKIQNIHHILYVNKILVYWHLTGFSIFKPYANNY